MRLIKRCSEDAVLSTWFINEAQGRLKNDVERFLQGHPHYRSLIESPNLQCDCENRRRAILGWLSRGMILFELPLAVKWYAAEVSSEDLADFLVIPNKWWNSHYGASNVLSELSQQVFTKDDHAYVKFLLGRIESFDRRLVLIGRKGGPYTIIDGVHRSIALYIHYFINSDEEFSPFTSFLGISERKCIWQEDSLER